MRLGELLLQNRSITPDQLDRCLEFQKRDGGRLGTSLLEMSFIDEAQLLATLSEQQAVPVAPLEDLIAPETEAIELFDQNQAVRYEVLPTRCDSSRLEVALLQPTNLQLLDDLSFITGKTIVPRLTHEARLFQALERHYGVPAPVRFSFLVQRLDNEAAAAPNAPPDGATPDPAAQVPEEPLINDEQVDDLLLNLDSGDLSPFLATAVPSDEAPPGSPQLEEQPEAEQKSEDEPQKQKLESDFSVEPFAAAAATPGGDAFGAPAAEDGSADLLGQIDVPTPTTRPQLDSETTPLTEESQLGDEPTVEMEVGTEELEIEAETVGSEPPPAAGELPEVGSPVAAPEGHESAVFEPLASELSTPELATPELAASELMVPESAAPEVDHLGLSELEPSPSQPSPSQLAPSQLAPSQLASSEEDRAGAEASELGTAEREPAEGHAGAESAEAEAVASDADEPETAASVLAEPEAADPATAELAPAETAGAEPAVAEPAVAESVPAEPVLTEPEAAEPLPSEAVPAETAPAEPLLAELSTTEPSTAEPALPDAVVPAAIVAGAVASEVAGSGQGTTSGVPEPTDGSPAETVELSEALDAEKSDSLEEETASFGASPAETAEPKGSPAVSEQSLVEEFLSAGASTPEDDGELRSTTPLGTIMDLLATSRSANGVGRYLHTYLREFWQRVVLFQHRQDTALGWIGDGPGVTDDAVTSIEFDLKQPSVFDGLHTNDDFFFGPLSSLAAHDELVGHWQGSRDQPCLVFPVRLGERTACSVFCDLPLSQPSFDVSVLQELTRAAAEGLERSLATQRRAQ